MIRPRIALVLAIVILALPSQAATRARQPKASKRVTPSPPVFVLIHSPLVGPATWEGVAGEMRQRGIVVVVPSLKTVERTSVPFWKQHAESVKRALKNIPADRKVVLVAHSGAGMLLPAIRQVTGRRVAASFCRCDDSRKYEEQA